MVRLGNGEENYDGTKGMRRRIMVELGNGEENYGGNGEENHGGNKRMRKKS